MGASGEGSYCNLNDGSIETKDTDSNTFCNSGTDIDCDLAATPFVGFRVLPPKTRKSRNEWWVRGFTTE